MNEITKLGYMVLDKGNAVMCMSTKEMVLTTDAKGIRITEVPEIKAILGMDKPKAKKKKPATPKVKTELVWNVLVIKMVTSFLMTLTLK